jgi:hypothetical protein
VIPRWGCFAYLALTITTMVAVAAILRAFS